MRQFYYFYTITCTKRHILKSDANNLNRGDESTPTFNEYFYST